MHLIIIIIGLLRIIMIIVIAGDAILFLDSIYLMKLIFVDSI